MSKKIPLMVIDRICDQLKSSSICGSGIRRDTSTSEGVAAYDDFDYCREVMTKGIEAIKFNYSNNRQKRVKIWFSKDLSTLYYRNL